MPLSGMDRMGPEAGGPCLVSLARLCYHGGTTLWAIGAAHEGMTVTVSDIWSISIYTGTSPLTLVPAPQADHPVLTAAHVTDMPAAFVADPFLLYVAPSWYLFFEALHAESARGVIALATSADAWHWHYERVVVHEPFHLSYPYVFPWEGAYYMVPETLDAGAVRLYQARHFPDDWTCVADLLPGQHADPTLFQAHGLWWMFVCPTPETHDTLALYYAESLRGPWQAHPHNPLIQGDAQRARPGGRVTRWGTTLLRFAQDDAPYYGRQVRAFAITSLSPTHYAEQELAVSPIFTPSGSGWNARGIHHVDPQQLPDATWLASVDGQAAVPTVSS